MSTTLDENVDRIFNERDYKVFKWIFCRYVCLIGFGPTTDYTLFVNSGLRGYISDEPMMKEYVLDNADNVYNACFEYFNVVQIHVSFPKVQSSGMVIEP